MNAPAPGHTNLPAAVRAQVAEAHRLVAELNAPPPQPGAAPVSPAAQPPAQPAASVPPAQPSPHPGAAPPPSPGAVADATQDADLREQLRRSEARFSTLQGKYNAETEMLRQQLNQNTQLMTEMLARDRAAPPPAPPAPVTPEDRVRSLGATDKEIEEYGDLLPLVARLAENMVKPTIEKLNTELARLNQTTVRVAQDARRGSVASLEAQLDAAVPTWRQINESQEFLDWLGITDIFSGVTRRVALTDAYNKLDAARVVAIFQAYVREYPAQARAPGAAPVDPATLVAPEVRGGPPAAPEGSGGKRMLSESEIADFYARVRKKQVSPEQYQAFMQEIARASAEGRIVPTRRMRHANEAF
ncbi:MAG TPA: hypothetical protein VN734_17135 [Acidobacteriaceae bacterium]|nr:hypothetical protein [Acidobacteriaceae bacterium]